MKLPNGNYFDPSTGFTIMFWIKYFTIQNWQKILEFSNQLIPTDYIVLQFSEMTTKIHIDFLNNNIETFLSSVNSINLNEWTHLSVTYNGGLVNLYINGIQDAIGICLFRSFTASINYVGLNNQQNTFFNGAIDELKIYKRAINQKEIIYKMNIYYLFRKI
jgi:hypothetical protein